MIIYTTRTKRLPTSTQFYNNDSNIRKMFQYDENLMNHCGDYRVQEQVTSDVFNLYNALINFNNSLDKRTNESFKNIDRFIEEHEEIKTSRDYKCRNYYEKIVYWNNKYKLDSSEKSLNEIKSDIQDIMKYLAKQEIIKESGCNLKENYY